MSVFSSDAAHAVDALVDLIRMEPDPVERLALLRSTTDLMAETVRATSDSAIYEVRLRCRNIDEVCEIVGLGRWSVKAAIQRHCARHQIATPRDQSFLVDYVPIV